MWVVLISCMPDVCLTHLVCIFGQPLAKYAPHLVLMTNDVAKSSHDGTSCDSSCTTSWGMYISIIQLQRCVSHLCCDIGPNLWVQDHSCNGFNTCWCAKRLQDGTSCNVSCTHQHGVDRLQVLEQHLATNVCAQVIMICTWHGWWNITQCHAHIMMGCTCATHWCVHNTWVMEHHSMCCTHINGWLSCVSTHMITPWCLRDGTVTSRVWIKCWSSYVCTHLHT